MTLYLGQSVSATGSTVTSLNLPPLTEDTNVVLVLFVRVDGSLQVSSITDTSGLAWVWALRASRNHGGPVNFEEWWTVAESIPEGTVVTVTLSGSTALVSASLFGVWGANLVTPFDADVSLPATGTAELTVSTLADNAFIFGGYRHTSTEEPTAGTGFTRISGADFLLTEYQIYTEPQTSLTVEVGTGVGDINAAIVDVIVRADEADYVAQDPVPDPDSIIEVMPVEVVRISMTGTLQFVLTEFEADNGTVVEAVYDEETGDLVSEGSQYVFEEDKGGVLYRVVAVNPVIRDDMVTFTLRDAEQIS